MRPFFRKFAFLFAIFSFLGVSSPSLAGYRNDRLVVWVNLDEAQNVLNASEIIRNFIISGKIDKNCGVDWGNWNSVLYMKKRPSGITNDLIRKVFLEKDEISLRYLGGLLKSFRDDERGIDEGLDGVVVYSEKNGPRMMNFVTGRKKIKTYKLSSDKSPATAQDIEEAFCVLLPPVTRAP